MAMNNASLKTIRTIFKNISRTSNKEKDVMDYIHLKYLIAPRINWIIFKPPFTRNNWYSFNSKPFTT